MRKITPAIISITAVLFSLLIMNACKPIKNMSSTPATWTGKNDLASDPIQYDSTKRTVFIIADSKLTELFDMMAPFYLFNASGKSNVYIVAKDKTPILIKRELFVKPQLTFSQADALKMKADVIVIPALSNRSNQQDTNLIAWIRNHYTPSTKVLAVCDGAATAAATGLYDGKFLTCHASDYAGIKQQFDRPSWVQNVSVTKSGNLFSTAGVSNAVEGSLTIIEELFGTTTMQEVLNNIHYPHQEIQIQHKSTGVNGRHKMTAFKKIFFRKNKNVGVFLEDGINEFDLASVLDTYGRTFAASLTTYIRNDSIVKTKYGLSLIFTGDAKHDGLDELHVLMPDSFSKNDELGFRDAKIIRYENLKSEYPINACLKRIGAQYGRSFEQLVKVSLDYN